ncbi:M56 family metallopeptidase [Persicirhabdus sediminis]|uniref:Carboxypeptidase regulatory-like domain-containing protein n=1 Tax=Persicirhabdus sediminis TaxID=454144 RepID=A0A8J7MFN9_9BACT|nr:M56 family metallopeptidase [Persicirhabdus sediminis]MBK1790939.1 carboxypeptidase regulatory-like domain-containing protein [Persicirhabdus sediminis]
MGLFEQVLEASAIASVLAVVIFLLLLIAGKRIAPSWRHGLSLLVVVRLLLISPPSAETSWETVFARGDVATAEQNESVESVESAATDQLAELSPPAEMPQEFVEPAEPNAESFSYSEAEAPSAVLPIQEEFAQPEMQPVLSENQVSQIDWSLYLMRAWLAGCVIFAVMLLVNITHLQLVIRSGRRVESDELIDALNQAGQLAVMSRLPRVVLSYQVGSPAVTGLFRPTILFPRQLLGELERADLEMILLHELGHVKRRDLWFNALMLVAQVLHWFNPLVWLACKRIRIEAEAACDSWVLSKIGENHRDSYGHALLNLLENMHQSPTMVGAVSVLESSADLKNRLLGIANYRKGLRLFSALFVITCIGIFTSTGFTKAPEETLQQEVIQEEVIQEEVIQEEVIQEEVASENEELIGENIVTVKVLDPAGQPAPNATVYVQMYSAERGEHVIVDSGMTDALGIMRFDVTELFHEHEGLNHLHLHAKGEKSGVYFDPWLRVGSQIDSELRNAQIKLEKTSSAKVRFLKPDQSPAVGLSVFFESYALSKPVLLGDPGPTLSTVDLGRELGAQVFTGVTDLDGWCDVSYIPDAGGVYLMHDGKEYANLTGKNSGILTENHLLGGESKVFTLATASSIRGQVLDVNGNGAHGVLVGAYGRMYNYYYAETFTDNEGKFELTQLPHSDKPYGVVIRHLPKPLYELNYSSLSEQNIAKQGELVVSVLEGGVVTTEPIKMEAAAFIQWKMLDALTKKPIELDEPRMMAMFRHKVRTGKQTVQFYNGSAAPVGYQPNKEEFEIELQPGETIELEVEFEKEAQQKAPAAPQAGVKLDPAGDNIVTVTVLDPAGKPASNATVYVRKFTAYSNSYDVLSKGKTDASGEYRFDASSSYPKEERDIMSGRDAVDFVAYAAGKGIFIASDYDSKKLVPGEKTFTLRLEKVRSARAQYFQADGTPAAGMNVRVGRLLRQLPSDHPMSRFGYGGVGIPRELAEDLFSAVTDEQGFCTIANIPEFTRAYLLHDWESYANVANKTALFFTSAYVPLDGVSTFKLKPAGNLDGQVSLPDGSEAEGVAVYAFNRDQLYRDIVLTDKTGRYSFKQLPAGTYEILLNVPPALVDEFIAPRDKVVEKVSVGENKAAAISLAKVAYVKVSPIDSETRESLAGGYELRVPAGKCTVQYQQLRPEGYADNNEYYSLEIGAGETKTVDIEFSALNQEVISSIKGQVVDVNGLAVEGAEVIIRSQSQHRQFGPMDQLSDAEGRFAFEFTSEDFSKEANLETELVRIFVRKGELYSTTFQEWKLGETEAKIVVKNDPSTAITGIVIDEEGAPIMGANVMLWGGLPQEWRREQLTDKNGHYHFENLAPVGVELNISVAHSGYGESDSNAIVVIAGESVRVENIVLPKADQHVSGVLLDRHGKPVKGETVQAHGYRQPVSLAYSHGSALTDVSLKDGSFKIDGLVSGWLDLTVKWDPTDRTKWSKTRVKTGDQNIQIIEPTSYQWHDARYNTVDLIGQPMPELKIEKWYHAEPVDVNAKGKVKVFLFQAMDRSLMWSSNTLPLHEKLVKENPELDIFIIHTTWPQREVDEVLANQFPDFKTRFALEAADQPIQAVFKAARLPHLVVDENGIIVMQTDRAKAAIRKAKQLVD